MKTEKAKKTNGMGLTLLAAGFVFLINPCYHIIDILPDFIGLILMAVGIDKLADMESHFARAKKSFIYVAIISAVKTVSIALLPKIDEIFVILLVFCFGLLEAIFFIPAIVNLFGGFEYYGLREGSKSANNNTTSVKSLFISAYSIRVILSILPEVPKLFVDSSTGTIEAGVATDWVSFTGIFYFMSFVVVLAVGIPALVQIMKYILAVRADGELMSYLSERYEESFGGELGFFADKQIRAANVLLIIGSVFCINIYMDYVNWMPLGVSAIFFGIACLVLRKNSKYAVPAVVANALWVIPSALSMVFQIEYASFGYKPTHFAAAIGKTEFIYPKVIIASIADALLMAAAVTLTALCILDTLRRHARLYEENLPDARAGKGETLFRDIKGKYMVVYVLAMVLAALYVAYPIVCVYYPEIWLVNLGVSVALIACLVRAIGYTRDELYDRLIGNF